MVSSRTTYLVDKLLDENVSLDRTSENSGEILGNVCGRSCQCNLKMNCISCGCEVEDTN